MADGSQYRIARPTHQENTIKLHNLQYQSGQRTSKQASITYEVKTSTLIFEYDMYETHRHVQVYTRTGMAGLSKLVGIHHCMSHNTWYGTSSVKWYLGLNLKIL